MPTRELLNYGFEYNPELIEIRKKGHQGKPQKNN